MIIGACDCPFCGPHALTTPSTKQHSFVALFIATGSKHHRRRILGPWRYSSQHITSFGVFFSPLAFSYWQYTFATRFRRHVSRETGGRLIPLCPFLCAGVPHHHHSTNTSILNSPSPLHLHLIGKSIRKTNRLGWEGASGRSLFYFSSILQGCHVSVFGFCASYGEACLRYPLLILLFFTSYTITLASNRSSLLSSFCLVSRTTNTRSRSARLFDNSFFATIISSCETICNQCLEENLR